jgi:hypothetical protein
MVQHVAKRLGVRTVPIHDQVSLVSQTAVEGIGQIEADLHHPSLVRTWRRSCEMDSPTRKLDHDQDIERDQSSKAPDLDMVSGVTSVATSSRARRPMALPFAASRRR